MGTSFESISRRVPFDRLTIAHPCISAFELYREGFLVPGTQATLLMAQGSCQLAAREGRILIDGQPVGMEWHPCFPCWVFVCPAGGHPCHKLYEVGGQWACFRCHGLEHASRHGAVRAMPALHKLIALRRKLGADLRPVLAFAAGPDSPVPILAHRAPDPGA